MEFHISRQARDRYQFDMSLFSLSGNVIFANFHAVRLFVLKINQKRDLIRFPEQAVQTSQINAMGLIDEIFHFVFGLYRNQINPLVLSEAVEWLNTRIGAEALDQTLLKFADEFPPLAVYRRDIDLQDYLNGQTGGIPNKQMLLEELVLLWLSNMNPAFAPYLELFDDANLEKDTAYREAIQSIHDFFETQPGFGPEGKNLIDMLRSPAIAVPYSLSGQLEYIREHWGFLLGEYLFRLLRGLDLISEEEKAIFFGPGPSRVYDFSGQEFEAERFSPDKDWMPSLMLIAKNAYVWLDQLSKKYQRSIQRLDQIPNEELVGLAGWGFKGLWLIGLWERSSASQRIKQLRGNPDAVASAYSLFDYQIANDLGGDQAYLDLQKRAWRVGIRLASDMVPNHMGIDSRWVIEHPDWFISLDYSPFPSYSYNGANLSWDDRVGIYIEDHYYDSSDAAVVFKRVDNWTGSTKFIYHGNDGTSMPWNDTAQLNYLIPEVREAVIQTILHVARKFPIIRFDAAMTLAKKHYQRLWFPEPGTGGAIPTRAEHGMTKEQFDKAFPVEFWREVVDRVAQEVPDTLLLAEAFWLMEGYFVRTLGMHRVYNSAFMNMLRDEKNQEYRLVIKNTLEFDPEILKRYVNFMNNPDERTAVDQFGKGDKYFGICTLMVTMPGLPMFGHGQIEGYTEKYGMEFRKAYWDEVVDQALVERHEREIFPLLRKRYLFAEVANFLLYDFYSTEGYVNEDVFAFSNRSGQESTLVVYHNRFAQAHGWIHTSSSYSIKSGGDDRQLIRRNLGEGLGLKNEEGYLVTFRDHNTGLEYIRHNRQIHKDGLYIELDAYHCHVFMDFQEIQDNEWHQYSQLEGYLNGRGVPSIAEALQEIFLQPLHYPFRELVNVDTFERLYRARTKSLGSLADSELLFEITRKANRLLTEVCRLVQTDSSEVEIDEIAERIRRTTEIILELPVLTDGKSTGKGLEYRVGVDLIRKRLTSDSGVEITPWAILFGWAFTSHLGEILADQMAPSRSRSWIDEWLLGKILLATFQDLGIDLAVGNWAVRTIKVLVSYQNWTELVDPDVDRMYSILQAWLMDEEVQRYIGFNRYQDVLWFNKEAYEQFLGWMGLVAAIKSIREGESTKVDSKELSVVYRLIHLLNQAGIDSGYRVENLLDVLKVRT